MTSSQETQRENAITELSLAQTKSSEAACMQMIADGRLEDGEVAITATLAGIRVAVAHTASSMKQIGDDAPDFLRLVMKILVARLMEISGGHDILPASEVLRAIGIAVQEVTDDFEAQQRRH